MSKEPSNDRPILSGPAVVAICILWACIWLVSFLALGQKRIYACCSDSSDQFSLRFYNQKLRRMLIYSIASTVAGLAMLAHTLSMPAPFEDMMTGFRLEHQVFFAMAIAHFTINCWEDWVTRGHLGQGLSTDSGGGLTLFPLNLCLNPDHIMLMMYMLHHVATVFAYIYGLATHELSGCMVQGLIFELPVVLMLRREMGIAQNPPPAWLQRERSVHFQWAMTYVFFLLGRLPAEAFWIVAIVPSHGSRLMDQLLGTRSIVVFHTFGVFFTSINIRIFGLLMTWHVRDAQRSRLHQQTQKTQLQQRQQQQQQTVAHATHVAGDHHPQGPSAWETE